MPAKNKNKCGNDRFLILFLEYVLEQLAQKQQISPKPLTEILVRGGA